MAKLIIFGVLLFAGITASVIPPAHAQDFNRKELLHFAEQKSAEWKKAHHIHESLQQALQGKLISGTKSIRFSSHSGVLPVLYQTSNLGAAEIVSNTKIWDGGIAGLDLSGSAQIIGFWDLDQPRLGHTEFSGRVSFSDTASGSMNNHATQMVGTMIAEGIETEAKGMAFNASVEAYNWDNDAAEMAAAAAENLTLSAHPYINSAGWVFDLLEDGKWVWFSLAEINSDKAYQFGYYDQQARDWDQVAYLAPGYLMIKAAGNQRGKEPESQPLEHWEIEETDGEFVFFETTAERPENGGATGFETLTSASLSKNVLVVGAAKSTSGDYSDLNSIEALSGSGFGPTNDGRIKPDITAPAEELYTTTSASTSSYGTSSGTSAAASVVAGSSALIAEHYQNLFADTLSSAGMRALLSHTSDDIGNPGPDYTFGWGMLNTERAARFVSANKADEESVVLIDTIITESQTLNFFYYNSSKLPLKITVAWTDPAGTVPDNLNDPDDLILVNDLGMSVTNAGMEVFEPWILDKGNPSSAALTGNNVADNIEQVFIENPDKDTYEIEISHKGSLESGSQRVVILISPEEPEIVRETIAGGNWENPAVWDDGNIPTVNYNRANILHEITLNENTEIHSLSFNGENAQLNLNDVDFTLHQNLSFSEQAKGFFGDTSASLNITGINSFLDSLKFAPGGEKLQNFIMNIKADDVLQMSSNLDIYSKAEIQKGSLNSEEGKLGFITDSAHAATLIVDQGGVSGTISYARTFYPASGWRLISVPFSGVNFNSLNEAFHTQGGSWASYEVPEPNSNLWFFDADNQAYEGYYGPNSAFSPGNGFLMYMYEDFANGTPSLPGTWKIYGEKEDSVSISLYKGDTESLSYNLVGNPFAGTLDWHQIVEDNTGIATNYAIWNPALTDAGGTSGFLYYNREDGIGAAGRYIAPMQGFFIQATESDAEINFTQGQKAAGEVPVISGKYEENQASSWIQFHLLDEEKKLLEQEIYLVINPDASRGYDKSDITRFASLNGKENTISFAGENGEKLAFEGRSLESGREEFEMLVDISRSGDFELRWPEWKHLPEEWTVILTDKESGTKIDMRNNSGYAFQHESHQQKKNAKKPDKLILAAESEPRFMVTVSKTSEDQDITPDKFSLVQNYPNPFNPTTVISYHLPTTSRVQLLVFDILGREIAVLVDGKVEAGIHSVSFDASSLASGMYMYQLKAGEFVQTRKMTVIK